MDDFEDLLGTPSVNAAENNLRVALKLASQGFPVFPCREKPLTFTGKDGEEVTLSVKSPYGGKGGFHNATTDRAEIERLWRKHKGALVGLPTGKKSGLAVIDVDRHEGRANGVDGLRSLGYKPSDLSDVSATTPGNGMHLYFEWQEGIGISAKHILNGKGGIDIRGEGGYVIAPGTVMPDGRAYSDADLSSNIPVFPSQFMPPHEDSRNFGETGDNHAIGWSVEQIREAMRDIPNSGFDRSEWLNYVAALSHEALAPDEFGEFRSDGDVEEILKIAMDWTATDPVYNNATSMKKVKHAFKTFKHEKRDNPRTFRSIVKEVTSARFMKKMQDDAEGFDEVKDVDGASDAKTEVPDDFEDLIGSPGGDVVTDNGNPVKKQKKPKWMSSNAPDWVKEMNRKHALIIIGGKASVMNFFTDEQGVEDHELWDTKTFHDWYLSKGTVPVPAGKDAKGKARFKDTTMSHAFMANEYRRGYERGYVFDPKKSIEDGFNLFVGWGVEPKKGDCSKILWHVKNVMCNGDETAYEYFLDYFAHLFQRPWEIPRAAIVIRSGEGAGKDTWAEYISRIVGRYMPKITGQDQFFGNFNGFLKNALFVNMQEAFVGSQQQNEKLKQYITERTIKVENKYQNAYDTPNLMRLFITSNNFRVVAASESARRFLVLKASEEFISNGDPKRDAEIKTYFDALYDELNGKGPAALLHYLLNRELVNFPRIPPATRELSSQVALNWKGMKKFFYYAAANGTFDDEDPDPVATKEKWLKEGLSIEKSHLRALFNKWCRGQQKRDLDEFEPTMTAFTQAVYTYLGAKDVRPRVGNDATSRPRFYQFPRLEFAREAMSKAARGKLEWHDEQETDHLQNLPDEEDDLG